VVDRGEVRPRIDLGQVLGMNDRVWPRRGKAGGVGRRLCSAHRLHIVVTPGGPAVW
jgi:hypothetical protein